MHFGSRKSSITIQSYGAENVVNIGGAEKETRQCQTRGDTSLLYRWTIVFLLSGFYFIANFTIGAITPAVPLILDEFGPIHNRDAYQSLFVSIWGCGQAVGPLLMGPLSESFGRLPIQHISTILFIIFCVGGAVSNSVQAIIGFRFLMALTNTSSALNGPIVGDIFPLNERGRAMALNQIISVIGTGLGPLGGGLVTAYRGWRWSFWLIAIITAGFEIPLLILLRESYRPKLNGTIQRPTTFEEAVKPILRPFTMLFTNLVLFLISLYGTVAYGIIYIIMSTIVEMFMTVYDFSTKATSFSFVGIGIGMVSAGLLYISFMDRYIQHRTLRCAVGFRAEFYLPPTALGGLVIPAGLFMYGWAVEGRAPWVVCFLGSGLLASGVLTFMVVANNYLVSAFGRYSASATAASMVLRFVGSATWPLMGPPLFDRLGYGWGSSLLAFVALGFVPIPLLLIRYGAYLRVLGPYGNFAEKFTDLLGS